MDDFVIVNCLGRMKGTIIAVDGDISRDEIGKTVVFSKKDAFDTMVSDDGKTTTTCLPKDQYDYL